MSDLEQVGDGLEKMLNRLGMPSIPDLERLVTGWSEIAGEPWASRSRPVGLNDGELRVEVSDGSTATLLKYQESGLLDRLEAHLGARMIDSVRLRVATGKNRP